ncbi:MAG: tetratricopeptide repeat protein, partial [Bacteroidia bacterium]
MKTKSLLCLVFLFVLTARVFSQKAGVLRQIDSLRKALSTVMPDSGLAKTLVETGEVFYDISPDSSMRYWTKSEAFCQQVLKKKLEKRELFFFKSYLARTYNNIAYFYQRNDLKTAEAFSYYEKALQIEEKIGNFKEEGKTLNNLATLYFNIGDEDNCILYHHRALKAREKAGYMAGIIISMNNLTAVYLQQGELVKAMEYSRKAEATAQVHHLPKDLPVIFSNRARIFLLQHDTLTSETYYRKALVYALRSGSEAAYCDANVKMATLFVAEKRPDSAITVLSKALPIAERLKIIYTIIDIHQQLGHSYLQKRNIPEAKKHAGIALELAQKINRRFDVGECAGLLSEIFTKENNPAKAFELYKLHIAVKDSFLNETTRRNTIHEQLQYDYEKKTTGDSLRAEADKRITAVKFQQEKTLRYGLYGGILILLVFGGMIFNR